MDIENEKIREAAYWRERYNILNATNAQLTQQTYDEAERAFELAKRDIQRDIDAWLNRFADNNGVSLVEARKLLNSNELKELKWDVAEYIKRGRENAISGKWAKELENASARLHISRLEALKLRTQNHLETAFAAENKTVENLVKNVYKSDYYHTCFELQKGFGVGFDISGIDERQLDMIIKKPWTVDRRTFSDRIWERKDKMVSALHQEMIRNCIYGRSRKEMTAALEQFVKKDIKNAEYCAARVIKTETAYFTSQSQRQALSDLDCEMYEVYLPLSPKSCEICREMNGKHFKLSEYVVGSTAPPFHPNCENGSVIPYYEDGFFDNIKSGEKIPEDITYPEWERKFVKDNGLTNEGESGIISTIEFQSATTIQEAEEFARNSLGIPKVSYKGVDVTTANEWNKGLTDAFNRFPELKKNFGFVGECHERNAQLKPEVVKFYTDWYKSHFPDEKIESLQPLIDKKVKEQMKRLSVSRNTMAQSFRGSKDRYNSFIGVTVNRDFGKDSKSFLDAVAEDVKSKFHPEHCDTIRSILDHEIGHQLDDLLDLRNNVDVQKLFNDRTNQQITDDLSKYAWDNTNSNKYSEFIAEAWAEYCNSPEPRSVAKQVGEIIESEYKKKFSNT